MPGSFIIRSERYGSSFPDKNLFYFSAPAPSLQALLGLAHHIFHRVMQPWNAHLTRTSQPFRRDPDSVPAPYGLHSWLRLPRHP
jgi:hypothetical protein